MVINCIKWTLVSIMIHLATTGDLISLTLVNIWSSYWYSPVERWRCLKFICPFPGIFTYQINILNETTPTKNKHRKHGLIVNWIASKKQILYIIINMKTSKLTTKTNTPPPRPLFRRQKIDNLENCLPFFKLSITEIRVWVFVFSKVR